MPLNPLLVCHSLAVPPSLEKTGVGRSSSHLETSNFNASDDNCLAGCSVDGKTMCSCGLGEESVRKIKIARERNDPDVENLLNEPDKRLQEDCSKGGPLSETVRITGLKSTFKALESSSGEAREKRSSLSKLWQGQILRKIYSSSSKNNCSLSESLSSTLLGDDCITEDIATESGLQGHDAPILQRLALNALNLTAPASTVLLKNRRDSWVQLSGHPGSLAPAGPGTIWKKRTGEPTETQAYQAIMVDPAKEIAPAFFREVTYQGEYFIEMQDLLFEFNNPCVMDIKMGTRTFLEGEVDNKIARNDLYRKMVQVDSSAPTKEEHEREAVTKLRYMDFRDNMSSSRSLGFRIDALKMSGSQSVMQLKTVRTEEEVISTLSGFLKSRECTKTQIISRLQQIRKVFEVSAFFRTNEVIGSSILIVYDEDKAGVWMIDFAKTVPLPKSLTVTHRLPWVLGNHEEGYLFGLDNLINIMGQVPAVRSKRSSFLSNKILRRHKKNSLS